MKLINLNNILSFSFGADNNNAMNMTSNYLDVDLNNNNMNNRSFQSKSLASNQKQSMKFNSNINSGNGNNNNNNGGPKNKFHSQYSGQKSTGNQQQGMNSSQNYRKKSGSGMSIPPMSMQSVRESRSPSPTNYTLLNSEFTNQLHVSVCVCY